MAIIDATYYGSYEDYEGGDEVPCQVDTDTWTVKSFGDAVASRWYDGVPVMCIETDIQLEDGRVAEAMHFDEYTDRVEYDGDIETRDAHERGEIILYDADLLAAAMDVFEAPLVAEAEAAYDFYTCQIKGIPALEKTTMSVADDVHDAAEHMKRALDTMAANNERVEGFNKKWVGFYDEYLNHAYAMMEKLEEIAASFDGVEAELRQMG